MKEGASYSMWASLGLQGGGRGVSIYKLVSPDGTTHVIFEPLAEQNRSDSMSLGSLANARPWMAGPGVGRTEALRHGWLHRPQLREFRNRG